MKNFFAILQAAQKPIVSWKMKAPEKKPLIKVDMADTRMTVRGTDTQQGPSPIQQLSEIQ